MFHNRRLLIGSVQRQFAGAGVTFSLSYTGKVSDTVGGTSPSYGSGAIGTADSNRVVAAAIWSRAGTSISSVTIGGVSATQVSGAAAANSTTTLSDIWYASVPTGTTATIAVTYAASTQRSVVYLYRVVTSTPTPNAAGHDQTTTLTSVATTINVPSGGGAINVGGNRNFATIPTWTNAVQDDSIALSGAQATTAATTTGTGSITVTMTVGAGGEDCLSSASWGP